MSVYVNAVLPMSWAFLDFRGESRVRRTAWAKRHPVDLKSASGKPECRFESGRGHHPRLLRGGRAIGFSNHTTADAAHPVARLCQRDHAAPELLALAGVDVVLAHERKPAVAGDAIDHDAGRQGLDRVAVAHRKRPDARRHEQLSARVDAEGSQVDAVAFAGLEEGQLPGLRLDPDDGNVVLAAVEGLLALELGLAVVAVGEIDVGALGVRVDRAVALRGCDVGGIGQGVLDEDGVEAEATVRLQLVGIKLVLSLDRDVVPWLRRME